MTEGEKAHIDAAIRRILLQAGVAPAFVGTFSLFTNIGDVAEDTVEELADAGFFTLAEFDHGGLELSDEQVLSMRTSASGELTQRSSIFAGSDEYPNGVKFLGGLFIAYGGAGGLATSTNGITWTTRNAQFGSSDIEDVEYANGMFVAVGWAGKISTSPDGITWTARTSGIGSDDWFSKVGTNGTGTWVVGLGGQEEGEPTLVTSTDNGATWAPQTLAGEKFDGGIANAFVRAIIWDGTQFLAVARCGTPNLLTSPDGLTWTARTLGEDFHPEMFLYHDGVYVAGVHDDTVGVGSTWRILTSTDLATWTDRLDDENKNSLEAIVSGRGLLVAVGGDTSDAPGLPFIYTSDDNGETWVERDCPVPMGGSEEKLHNVIWTGDMFVAAGDRALISSVDGVTWHLQGSTEFVVPFLEHLAYHDGMLVASEWTYLYSTPLNLGHMSAQDHYLLSSTQKHLPMVIADPGTAAAIPVSRSASIAIVTAGAETNTLAVPTFRGQRLTLFCDTHVGNRVVTASQRVNQAGNTIMTFGAVGDCIVLEAITIGGALRWQVVANDGVALSGS